ncbi:MAG: hypothetical protein Tp1111SUR522732_42 [Prokaryotic dsDNA virus sp.]|uniref:HipA family kinase n=1 Tax=Methylophaga sp. UBA2689 TaxID=1946878 RepID=UPI0011888389|nr:HipA family kinase [Methylophaga sp. UBA2689]QDP47104.1 MAG: hypothetical protein Tp1111SUR522732_42 [Prokaryotic dsDNA virus sp.]
MIRIGRVVNIVGKAPSGKFDAHLAYINMGDSVPECRAYIKELHPSQLIIELVCAILGRGLGLPIPEPVIAYSEDGKKQLFASVEVSYPDLNQFVEMRDTEIINTPQNLIIFNKIAEWSDIVLAITFDELIANGDRNTGNILFDGVSSFTLIDHNLAMRAPFAPYFTINNQLMNIKLLFTKDELSKQRLKNSINQITRDIPKNLIIDVQKCLLSVNGHINIDLLHPIIHFLEERILNLSDITTRKIEVKQKTLC